MKISQDALVEFTYTITDQDNNIVEQVDMPVNYIHGRHSGMHEKIEKALENRREGDVIQVTLDPDEGFGPIDPSMIFEDDIANVPEQVRHLGAEAEFHNDRGETRTFRVTRIENGKITMDGNHPLAGKAIRFTLKIIQVRPATEAELSGQAPTGQAAAPPDAEPPTLN